MRVPGLLIMENRTIIKIAGATVATAVVIMLIGHLMPVIIGLLAIIGLGVLIHVFNR